MEATQQWTTFIIHQPRPWLLVGSLLVGRNTEEAMILLLGDQLLGPTGALLVDLLLVSSNHRLLGISPSSSAPASSMCRFATHMVETEGLTNSNEINTNSIQKKCATVPIFRITRLAQCRQTDGRVQYQWNRSLAYGSFHLSL